MSEHHYPPDEYTTHVDFFGTPLPNILLRQHDILMDSERRAHDAELVSLRWEEGAACMQWELSKLMKRGKVLVKPERLERHLQELVVFAHTGRLPTWIRAARRELKGER